MIVGLRDKKCQISKAFSEKIERTSFGAIFHLLPPPAILEKVIELVRWRNQLLFSQMHPSRTCPNPFRVGGHKTSTIIHFYDARLQFIMARNALLRKTNQSSSSSFRVAVIKLIHKLCVCVRRRRFSPICGDPKCNLREREREKEGAIKFKLCFYDHDYEVAEKPVYFYFTTARQETMKKGGGERLYFSVLEKPWKGRNLKIWWFLKGPILSGKQLHFGVGTVHALRQPTNEQLWKRHVDFDIY